MKNGLQIEEEIKRWYKGELHHEDGSVIESHSSVNGEFLNLKIEKNTDNEILSCILCDSHHVVPEYIVCYRTPKSRICKGLHADCWEKNK